MARILRRLARLTALAALGALAAAALLWAIGHAPVVRRWVRAQVVAALGDALGAEIRVGTIGGTLGRTLVIEDLRIRHAGRTIARAARLDVRYTPLALLRRRLLLRRVIVTAPRVRAVREPDGWRLPEPRERTPDGRFTLEIARLLVHDGRVAVARADVEPRRRFALAGVEIDARIRARAGETVLEVAAVRATPRGVALSPVTARGRLRYLETVLELGGVEIATERSRVTAGGRVARGVEVDAGANLALDPRELRALLPGAPLRLPLHAQLRARGPWEAVGVEAGVALEAGGRVDGHGAVDLAAWPPIWHADLHLSEFDPGAALDGAPRARAHGVLECRGRGLGPAAPLAYRLRLGPSVVAGRSFERLALAGHATGGVHRARARVATPAGAASLRARVALRPVLAYRAAARVRIAHLEALVPALPGSARGRVLVEGRGAAASARIATFRATLDRGVVRDVVLEAGSAEAVLRGDLLEVREASVGGPAARADARGTLSLTARALDARLGLTADLRALGTADGAPLAGRVGAEATARGPLDDVAATVALTIEAPAWGAARAAQAKLTGEIHGLGGPAPAGRARLDALALAAVGRAPRDLLVEADWRRTSGRDGLDLRASARPAEGPADRLAIALERAGPEVTGRLRELVLGVPDGPPWTLAAPARLRFERGLAVETVTLLAEEQRLELAGVLGTTGASDATLDATRVRLAPLCRIVAGRRCAGSASGRARVRGTGAAPEVDVTLVTSALAMEGVEYGEVRVEARHAELRTTVHAVLDHPQAGALRLDGSVPVDLAWSGPRRDLREAPVDLALRASRLDLTFLKVVLAGELRESAGRVSVDLRIDGPRAAPRLEGEMGLEGGRFTLAAAGVPWEEVSARLVARGGLLEVTSLNARGGQGTLDGAGRLAITGAGRGELGVELRLHEFFVVRRPAYEAVVSGVVTVTGTVGAPTVTGRLAVVRALVRPAALPASEPSLAPDPTITVVGGPEAPPEEPVSPGTHLGDPVRLKVSIRIARNAWIRRGDANIELAGDLGIDKEPFGPVRLGGLVRLVRGWYAFQGRRFELEEGTIRFSGAVPLEPLFDVTAVYRTAEYRIVVRVSGAGSKPELTLASDPPLEQADVLAVLLFGKPTSQLGRGESQDLQRQAIGLAAGYVMPELRSSVMNTLGLDTLDVSLPQEGEGTGRDRAGRVSVGRYVAPDLFVSLGQEFGSRAAQVMGIEYGLTPRVSVRGSTTTRGDSAVDLFWHRRY
jgi:autotransporter translocation and assembly factor TamB